MFLEGRSACVKDLYTFGGGGVAVCWLSACCNLDSQNYLADLPVLFLLHQVGSHLDQIYSTGKPCLTFIQLILYFL